MCQADNRLLPSEMKIYSFREFLSHVVKGSMVDEHFVRHFYCRLCVKNPVFSNFDAMARHYCENHYYCHMCPNFPPTFFFREYEHLQNHLNGMHFSCKICYDNRVPEYFVSEEELKDHARSIHPQIAYDRKTYMFTNFMNALIADPTQFILGPNRGNQDLEFDVTLMMRTAMDNLPGAVRFIDHTTNRSLDQQMRQEHAERLVQNPEQFTTTAEVFNLHFPALPGSNPNVISVPAQEIRVTPRDAPGGEDEYPLLPQSRVPAAMRSSAVPALNRSNFARSSFANARAASTAASSNRGTSAPTSRSRHFHYDEDDEDDEDDEMEGMVTFKLNKSRRGHGTLFSQDSGSSVQEAAPRQVKLIDNKEAPSSQMTAYKKPNLERDFPALGGGVGSSSSAGSSSASAAGPSTSGGSKRYTEPTLTVSALVSPTRGSWASKAASSKQTNTKKSLKVPLSGNKRPGSASTNKSSSASRPGPSTSKQDFPSLPQAGTSRDVNIGASTSSTNEAGPSRPLKPYSDKDNEYIVPEKYAHRFQNFFVNFHIIYKQLTGLIIAPNDIAFFLKLKAVNFTPETSLEELEAHYNKIIQRFEHKTIDIIWPEYIALFVTNIAMQHRWFEFYITHLQDKSHDKKLGNLPFSMNNTVTEFTVVTCVKSLETCEKCAQIVLEKDLPNHILQHSWKAEEIKAHKKSLEGIIIKPVDIFGETTRILFNIFARFENTYPEDSPYMEEIRRICMHYL